MPQPGLPLEYLYIDSTRLSSYVEQIAAPVTYDKVPTWRAALSLSGPSAEGTQSRFARPLTTHEKLTHLQEHLARKCALLRKRPHMDDVIRRDEAIFVIETIDANRYEFPPTSVGGLAVPSFSLWASRTEADPSNKHIAYPGQLLLITDSRADDNPYSHVMSSFSGLTLLLSELEESTKIELPQGKIVEAARRSAQSDSFINTKLLSDISGYLTQAGGYWTGERRITALYRVRSSCAAYSSPPWAFVNLIIGYPIAVSAS